MSQIFYISDTHFGHANIIHFDGRPFKDTLEMEQTLIKNWNEKVTKEDVVYILGDFCWSKEKSEWLKILDQLNGSKYLIRGNHDLKNPPAAVKNKFRQITDYKEITDNGKRIIMSHYPILFYRSSYNEGTWHFCGHTHNRTAEEILRQNYVCDIIGERKLAKLAGQEYQHLNRGHIINVGCMMDYMNYTPRTADELIEWWRKHYAVD